MHRSDHSEVKLELELCNDLVSLLIQCGEYQYQYQYQYQIIGIDSEFCLVESLVTGIVDMWPEKLRWRIHDI